MKISQIFYWNCRWKRHVEEGFLYVCFYLGIHCFFQLLGGSFRLIFFALISRIFCRGRISNAALQNYFSMPLKEYSERSFVFLPFSANMSMACFFLFSWSHKAFTKLFAKQISVKLPQQICLLLQHFFGLLCWAGEGCQNIIPSKIYVVITGPAQQEHCFLNIRSNII